MHPRELLNLTVPGRVLTRRVPEQRRSSDEATRLAGLLSLAIVLGTAGTAMATHCYVADKPAGAGTNGAFQREKATRSTPSTFKWDLPDPAHERGSQTHGILELEE
jgi:hypothetical protein